MGLLAGARAERERLERERAAEAEGAEVAGLLAGARAIRERAKARRMLRRRRAREMAAMRMKEAYQRLVEDRQRPEVRAAYVTEKRLRDEVLTIEIDMRQYAKQLFGRGTKYFMSREVKADLLKRLKTLENSIDDEISKIEGQKSGVSVRSMLHDIHLHMERLKEVVAEVRETVNNAALDSEEAGIPGGIPEAGGGVPAARGDIRIESDEARQMLNLPDWEERTSYNWWEILGFKKVPSRDKARKKFKKLAATTHPDVKPEGSEERAIADDAFKAVSQAAGMIPEPN